MNIDYVQDANGNTCTVAHFGSLEAAQAALDSLKNCSDCWNCAKCLSCRKCKYCVNCTKCKSCDSCTYCWNCEHCWGCERCRNCRECSFCRICSNCENIHGGHIELSDIKYWAHVEFPPED